MRTPEETRYADLKAATNDLAAENKAMSKLLAARDAEIAELKKEVKKWKEEYEFQGAITKELLTYQERTVKAEAQVAELRKDAERWHEVKRRFDAQKTSAAAIDAAIKESKR